MDFNRFAKPYTWLTDHALWRANAAQVAKQLPPSRARLALLDIGCGAGRTLRDVRALRPDVAGVGLDYAAGMLHIADPGSAYVQGSAMQLPFPSDSFDAVISQRMFYFLGRHQAGFLAEVLRVLRPGGRLVLVEPVAGKSPREAFSLWRAGVRPTLDMLAWHIAASRIGGFTPETLAARLIEAGYARVLSEPVMRGFGVLGRGEKPYPAEATTPERVAIGAADPASPTDLTPLRGADIGALPGRYLHLLIKQTPNKPAWALAPSEPIRWEAAAIQSGSEPPLALAFTSLPKAVAFMQAAVVAGAVRDVHKIAKFRREVVADLTAGWGGALLVNAELEAMRAVYGQAGLWLPVPVESAEAPDE